MSKSAADDLASGVRHVALRFPALLGYRPIAIGLVSALLEQVEHVECSNQDFRHELLTAFGEAFNNIAIHGYKGRSDGMLEVEAVIMPDSFTLRLLDTGKEVDFGEVEPPDLESMPESGMGVFLIHALVDEVDYRAGPPNVLSLTKRTSSSEVPR
jgi:serine/threonine-protein kinase RsbW